MTRHAGAAFGMMLLAHAAAAEFTQQGNKLVGTGAVGAYARQGTSVAISADGATAIVGGPGDNSGNGATWAFTLSGGVWLQQGFKLLSSDSLLGASLGTAVAISGDGNTAIVGGPTDHYQDPDLGYVGAAWVFTRTGGVWSQQGSKLVGTVAVGGARQGTSVAISADGITAIVGGPNDRSGPGGAAWVYTRSGSVWSQQGDKLVGTGAVWSPNYAIGLGTAVAISADGNTAIVGAPGDNGGQFGYSMTGAAWVFTRNGGVWSQQGSKLVGTGGAGSSSQQGWSVAISADGNTAVVGSWQDNSGTGAAWVFTRSGGVWSQQGDKLVGAGTGPGTGQAKSVAISADGDTVIVGGPNDSTNIGAAWVYTRSGEAWTQRGKLVGTGGVGYVAQGTSVAISEDGSAIIVGGPDDNTDVGAAWIFAASGCTAPAIYVQPQSQSFRTAQSATLSAAAAGTAPISFQWYQGPSGDTSNPVGTNSSSLTTPTLTATTSYWVRVSNPCGHADSATATVWIGCTPPSITVQPQSQSIQSGQSAVVSVGASGMPLAFQWYQGSSGDTSNPVGTNSSSFTTPLLTATTSYWVLVSNLCGQADSATATVTVTPLYAYFTWVPVASHNGGLFHSEWRSDLGLLNTGGVTANVQVRFFGSNGVLSNDTNVAPGVESILTDVVGQVGGSGSGALEIASDRPLRVTSRSYNRVAPDASCYAGGTQGQDYPAVVPGDGLAATQSAYLAGLSENAQYRCNIGVVNTGTGSATALVELFSGAGAKFTDYTVTLDPGDWKQETQPFMKYAGQTTMDRGYAKVTVQAGSGVFALASVIDNITNDPTTVGMQGTLPASVVWVPVASHNPGLNHSRWRSDLGLLNAGSVAANVQVKFFGSGGLVTTTTLVPPQVQSVLTDVVGQLGASGSGTIEILSDEPVNVTARSYNQVAPDASCYANGTQGQDYPAVVASEGLAVTQSAYLTGLTENASYRSNIGVVNTGTEGATVLVQLFDGIGTKLTEYPVALNPGEWKQETQPFLNKAGQQGMDRGYAKITVQTGSGVFGFASVIDETTNDPTTVTMQR